MEDYESFYFMGFFLTKRGLKCPISLNQNYFLSIYLTDVLELRSDTCSGRIPVCPW